jgi:hypothetical protein
VTKWDTLSPVEQGDLAGYAFGKYGSDILIPVASVKIVSKGVKELTTACRALKNAEQALALEGLSQSSGKLHIVSAEVSEGGAPLLKSQLKSIQSLEKQIQKHQQKLEYFRSNPTIKPGMENLSKDLIKQQQEARVRHQETGINSFKNNIEKIKTGKL